MRKWLPICTCPLVTKFVFDVVDVDSTHRCSERRVQVMARSIAQLYSCTAALLHSLHTNESMRNLECLGMRMRTSCVGLSIASARSML